MLYGYGRFSWRTVPALLAALLLVHAQALWACAAPGDMADMPCCPEQHDSHAGAAGEGCADDAADSAHCARPYAPVAAQAVPASPDRSSPDLSSDHPDFDPALLVDTPTRLASAGTARAASATAGPQTGNTGRLTYLHTLRLRL